MADTQTDNLKLTIQEPGTNANTWGGIANENFRRTDAKVAKCTSISLTGGTYVLTETEERTASIEASGVLATAAEIEFSGRHGVWIIANNTTGSYALTALVNGQTGVTIEQGGTAVVYCNGTDIALGNPPAAVTAEETIASDSTTDILGSASEFIAISGTNTIVSFGTGASRKRFVRATGAFKITHNATSLICPGGSDIQAAVGDTFIVISDASSHARIIVYTRAAAPPQGVPIGAVMDFGGTTAPSFWLFCYGQAISRTTYAALFSIIGTTFGVGDAVSTFNLPDCRGRVRAGQDDMGGSSADRLTGLSGGVNGDTLGATGGAETHTLTEAELAAHDHDPGTLAGTTNTTGAHTHIYGPHPVRNTINSAGSGANAFENTGTADAETSSNGDHSHTVTVNGATATAGSGSAHNNVQPTIVFNTIIFAGV